MDPSITSDITVDDAPLVLKNDSEYASNSIGFDDAIIADTKFPDLDIVMSLAKDSHPVRKNRNLKSPGSELPSTRILRSWNRDTPYSEKEAAVRTAWKITAVPTDSSKALNHQCLK
jgi:hypothetical protein